MFALILEMPSETKSEHDDGEQRAIIMFFIALVLWRVSLQPRSEAQCHMDFNLLANLSLFCWFFHP